MNYNNLQNGQSGQRINFEDFINDFSKLRTPAPLREICQKLGKLSTETINFGLGFPSTEKFPFKKITVLLKDESSFVIEDKLLESALQYLPSTGYQPLISLLKEMQDTIHGPKDWSKSSIVVCNGSQEGLSKAVEMCLTKNDAVIIQHPIYPGAIDTFVPYEPEFILAEQDTNGVQVDLLSDLLIQRLRENKKMPKIMYVNPTSNPTGAILSYERKKQLYELACKYNFLIFEDDPYYHVNYQQEYPPSIYSLDTQGRVLRFDSFSKILSSGLRTGYVTGSNEFIRQIELHVQNSSMHCSSFSQVILCSLLNEWGIRGFNEHLKDVRSFYKMKRDYMMKAVDKILRGLVEYDIPDGGMFLWVRLKGIKDSQEFVSNKCIQKLIMAAPGCIFQKNKNIPSSYVRLSYSVATLEQIDEGILRLATALKEEFTQQDMNNNNSLKDEQLRLFNKGK